jgi:hypothetical protein
MNDEITHAQLIDLLKRLVAERSTCTLYVHTDDNHLILVGVDRGEIVSLICGPKQGERAIPLIRRMGKGTYRLDDSVMRHSRPGVTLPSSDAVLSLLSDETVAAQGGQCEWVHSVLCKVLADFMGPIAPLVCRQTVSAVGGIDSPEKVRRVVDDLAKEIDNGAEAERFKAQAQKELRGLIA